MKPDIPKFARLAIVGTVISLIIIFTAWLNRSSEFPLAAPSQTTPAAQTELNGPTPSPNSQPGSPEVNPAALRGSGNLAFVWRGLIYTLDGKTGEIRQLTDSGRALHPAWSHDGEWLAFIRVTDSQALSGQLWLVRQNGSEAHQVDGLPELSGCGQFSWSPVANILAVGGQNGLWLVPAGCG